MTSAKHGSSENSSESEEPEETFEEVPEEAQDMEEEDAVDEIDELLPPPLARAFREKGYTTLTAVQRAVLADELRGRDLRISSQTGSGKTIALGLVLAQLVAEGAPLRPSELPPGPNGEVTPPRERQTGPREGGPRAKGPRALVIVPTRELAKQVEEELGWLYQYLGARVASVVGGTSYRDEHRALARGPKVIVATPGRLLDHMTQGSFDPSGIEAVVLDEADQMLDLGFADDLDAILAKVPDGRRAHLVSATFPSEVLALANRVQKNAIAVQGTRLGAANQDIAHVVHLLDHHDRVSAIINLLIFHEDARTLLFTRTRAGAHEIAELLSDAGFPVAHISGELAQRERTRTLDAFKAGHIRALVATDVAARGIDVQDIGLVIHVDAPTNNEAYTHRSGRTGRAGKTGTSAVLCTTRELSGVSRVFSRGRIQFSIEPLPGAQFLLKHADDKLVERLSAEGEVSDRTRHLAERLATEGDLKIVVANLLERATGVVGPVPREIRHIRPPAPPQRGNFERPSFDRGNFDRGGGNNFERPRLGVPGRFDRPNNDRPNFERPNNDRPNFERPHRNFDDPRFNAPRTERPAPPRDAAPQRENMAPRDPMHDASAPPRSMPRVDQTVGLDVVPFVVTWGANMGADPRKVMAMACRRGDVTRHEIGAIRVMDEQTIVEVRGDVASAFARAASRPDPRDPRVRIEPYRDANDAIEHSRAARMGSSFAEEAPRVRAFPAREAKIVAPRGEAAPRADKAEGPKVARTKAAIAKPRTGVGPKKAAPKKASDGKAPPKRKA
jgi:ATP-dependent RNA helicase DeaD